MKKLVILAMIGMIATFTSCQNSNDEVTPIKQESKSTFSNKTTAKGDEDPAIGEKVISITNAAVEYEVSHYGEPSTSKVRVKFCNNGTGFGGSEGQGYAQVTLDDGSVHYTHYAYSHLSTGFSVHSVYLGTYNADYMGC